MGLLDEWDKVKKNEGNKKEAKKFALTQGAPKTQSSYFPNNGKQSNVNPGIMNNGLEQTAQTSARREGNAGRNILPPGWQERNAQITAAQDKQSLMDQLMERITGQYEPMMPGPQGGPNPNDEIMARISGQLDQALAAKLGAIGNARNLAQENFNTSDSNLAAMFGANANNIASQGSARFGEIANNQRAGINATRDESLNRLSADRNNAMQQRQAMLQALGIEAAGAQEDPGDTTMQDAMTGITNRSNIATQGANQGEAINQTYNQSVVNSVNQQGTERRAALMQQLQAIQAELGSAEANVQGEAAQAKSALEIQRMQAEAQAQGQSFSDMNKFGYQQFNDNRDLAFDLWKTINSQDQQAEDTAMPKTQGYAGLGVDLINQGVPEAEAAQYMGALSQVIGSEYMQGIHPDEGYDRQSIISRRLQEMRVPPAIAAMLATNYANLGNNASFTAQQ